MFGASGEGGVRRSFAKKVRSYFGYTYLYLSIVWFGLLATTVEYLPFFVLFIALLSSRSTCRSFVPSSNPCCCRRTPHPVCICIFLAYRRDSRYWLAGLPFDAWLLPLLFLLLHFSLVFFFEFFFSSSPPPLSLRNTLFLNERFIFLSIVTLRHFLTLVVRVLSLLLSSFSIPRYAVYIFVCLPAFSFSSIPSFLLFVSVCL